MLTDYHLHLRPDEDGTTFERYFTAENVDRYLAAAAAAGIEELGVSEHVYRFRQALDLWTPPALGRKRRRRPRRLLRVRPRHAAAARGRVRLRPRRRGADRGAAGARATSTTSSARSTSSARATPPSTTTASTSGRATATPTRSGAATSRRSPPAPAPASSTSSPTPTWSRSGARARPLPERDLRTFYEPAVEAIAESGIAVEISTAGLRKPVGELYPSRRLRRDVRRGRRRLRALLRRPPARAGRLRIRRARSSSSTNSG